MRVSFNQLLVFVCAIGVCAIGISNVAIAQSVDRVWIQPLRPTSMQSGWFPRAIQVQSGEVLDFDAKQLRMLRTGDEVASVIASGRVLWVEPGNVSELEAKSIELYGEGKYAESLSQLPDILKQRPAVWRQQWITMFAAVNAWKSGRATISLELVGQLDRRPLPLVVVAWLPIAWENGVAQPNSVTAAKTRLVDPSPAVQLVAASWLLSSADRNQAVAVLRNLEKSSRVEIARLAEVLLWRTTLPPQVAESLSKWQTRLDALPMVLQPGPTRTIIDKLNTAGQREEAQRLQWSLELTPVHPHFPSS